VLLLSLSLGIQAQGKSSSKLPDPFTAQDGAKITSEKLWLNEREKIRFIFRASEFGNTPADPKYRASGVGGKISAKMNGNKLSITISTPNNKQVTISPSVRLPTGGQAPYPVMIALPGSSLPLPSNIAVITLNVE